MGKKIEDINRAKIEGFMEYMIENPYYFKSLSGMDAKEENITAFFRQLRREGLIAAANLPSECNNCDLDFSKCKNCEVLKRRAA